ncbi:MAG TPA: 50S ribosomal protein L4 [Nitrospinaceae bacterium]|jgi:large subunit ribosomal protein L4|nr:50S ribosomal protein L4 [Candidatus Neomarinimicrobiota bacterium]HIL26416.1 50S ribosomal protein L4 [Nitrospinaceae bacterium]|tara:strand:- start:73 stop:699 length:627 start_codon:yes stop_codon:yes gene_type:complete
MKLDIYQKSGKKSAKKVTLNEEVFGITPNKHCVYLAVSSEMASIRQGTHSSKTRAEVSGSGAKPWRQKGTGRARVGSIRNPSRVHGSKAFGPKPHKYDKKVNKKVRQLARRSVLSQKVSENNFIVIDNILPETPKTSEFSGLLKNFNLTGEKVTVLTDTMEENLYLGSRNIKNICVVPVESASTYDLLDCQMILANEASVEILNKQLS